MLLDFAVPGPKLTGTPYGPEPMTQQWYAFCL
jgi:hypothetical protein